ncbi:hypothetical protein BCR42DRAFT_423647 [Absidia repens]|uniref:F-box domain-containing protein n=1 Tax=Absidia repens TaxID=90262 RepID=A0A1X2I5D6_9FUNG|nr:hypothetical protein BCR42DRAFT_423647 [Absidia repens]
MNRCAVEILQLIFNLLPQNQIAICSLVCRSWYISTRVPLYHSIHFYSLDQVLAFINLTPPSSSIIEEKDTSVIRHMKTIPRGTLVRKMAFHIQIKEPAIWSALQIISPRIIAVDMIPENDRRLYGVCRHRYRHPLALQWQELKRLPVWHKDEYGLWNSLLSDQLLYLGLDVYFYDHLVVTDNTEEPSSSSIMNNNFITKTIHLPPMRCLQELDLYASRNFFSLNERSFELIHAACPSLQTLSLTSFQMHIISSAGISILAPTNLTSLYLDQFCIHDLNSYAYLGHKYPNLISFKVKDLRKGHHHQYNTNACDHRSALFSLITNNFARLKHLSADLYEPLGSNFLPSQFESIWPYNELRQWLVDDRRERPCFITQLHWSCLLPFDLLVNNDKKIEPCEITNAVFEFADRFYFSHLTSLVLITTSNASWHQVQKLWGKRKHTLLPLLPLLKTLKIQHISSDHNNGTSFARREKQDFFAVANACPKLTLLEIESDLFLSDKLQEKQIFFPVLEELVISNCMVSLEQNVTMVCQTCPRLKRLSLNNVQCQLQSPSAPSSSSSFIPTKESGYCFMLQVDLPLLSLDYLGLSNLWYERMMASDQRYTRRVAVNDVKVNQEKTRNMENQNAVYHRCTNQDDSTITQVFVLINCRYVERLNINQEKYK